LLARCCALFRQPIDKTYFYLKNRTRSSGTNSEITAAEQRRISGATRCSAPRADAKVLFTAYSRFGERSFLPCGVGLVIWLIASTAPAPMVVVISVAGRWTALLGCALFYARARKISTLVKLRFQLPINEASI
jgi:hypothetical protein